jgi:AraC-like DNA-binding protein
MPHTKFPALQRAATLMHLPPLLAELGCDLETVLDGTGVSVADLRPNVFITFASYLKILDRCVEFSHCADFGLRLGRKQSLASLGPVGQIMRCAATLGQALSDFSTLQIGNSTGAAVYLHRSGEDFAFGYGVYDPDIKPSREIYDVVVATGCNLINDLMGGEVDPLEILIIGRAPPDLAPYRALTTGPIRFDQSETCLILPKRILEFPLETADKAKREKLFAEFYQRLLQAPWLMSDRVKHVLRSLTLTGVHSMQEVASHLEIHPRSLQRKLKSEGTTFEALKEEIRYALARQLLALTKMPAADVSLSLAYSTPSSFAHAFQRWSGMSPIQWRRLQSDGRLRS